MKNHTRSLRLAAGTVSLTLLFALAAAGCTSAPASGNSSAPSAPVTSSAAPSEPAVSEGTSSQPSAGTQSEAPAQLFQAGTWLSDQGQYYFFDEGANSGRTSSLEDGTGIPFAYTFDGSQAVFSMGMAGNDLSCDVTISENTLTLRWEDGTTETLTFVSDLGSDRFQFYSNSALCQLALDYYKAHSEGADTEGLTAAAQTSEDGTVSIQVYQNLGDHNSTAAWYTVDRLTAQGTDGTGASVDLNA